MPRAVPDATQYDIPDSAWRVLQFFENWCVGACCGRKAFGFEKRDFERLSKGVSTPTIRAARDELVKLSAQLATVTEPVKTLMITDQWNGHRAARWFGAIVKLLDRHCLMYDSYASAIAALSACKNVLVTTHARPDGDALGSTAALVLGLRAKGIAADVLLQPKSPNKYAFVYENAGLTYQSADPVLAADFSLNGYDAFITVDTGTWSQLPGLRPHVEAFAGKKLVIDHHLTQEDWADVKLVDTTAGAACEIVAELLRQWDIPITKQIGEALYVGLVTDTGWFQYSNTRPYALRLAAALLELGVDADTLSQRIYNSERPQRVLLQAKAMQTLELLAGNRVAVMTISRDDLVALNATTNDTEGLINVPLAVKDVQASVLLSEPLEPDGAIRCSFRSKGQIDVAAFAQQFGGGGHARASGAKITGTLAAAKTAVVEKLLQTLA